jgi:HSP20 family protein
MVRISNAKWYNSHAMKVSHIELRKEVSTMLTRWHPLTELDRLRGEMDRLFRDLFDRSSLPSSEKGASLQTRGWVPPVDVIDRPEEVILRAMVPGMEKKDIQVTVSNGTLTLSGERKAESEIKDEDYYSCEQTYGKFYRTIDLPTAVKTDKVNANLKNGILEIRLPKSEAVKPKAIEIVGE